jgi:anti-sigma factor RsiW
MNCDQSKQLLQPYVDGELAANESAQVEQHLRQCLGCALERDGVRQLQTAIQNHVPYFRAPGELRRRIKDQLRRRQERTKVDAKPWWHWNFLAAAGTGALAACLALFLSIGTGSSANDHRLVRELVSSHIRSLMANHAVDVASSNQHTVKPWFNGKLDFSPPIKDLTDQDFPLLGGRLDYLGGRAVAALIFQRNKHLINLFIWPTTETETNPRKLKPLQGYQMIHWTVGGMTFWAVSDLNEGELNQFVQSFKAD